MAANNREFQRFMERYNPETVSTKVRSLMWECWVAATEAAEAGEPIHNSESKSAAQIFSEMDKRLPDLESFVGKYNSLYSVRG